METVNYGPEKVEKEEQVKVKGYVTRKFVIVTVAAGTGLYLIGRSKGFNTGFRFGEMKGRTDGYEQGVKDVGKMVNDIRVSMEANQS